LVGAKAVGTRFPFSCARRCWRGRGAISCEHGTCSDQFSETPFVALGELGLTNVITLRPDTLGVKYSELGLSNSVHSIGHLQENIASNGWTGHRARMEIEKLHLKQIAKMAKKFDSIPEGNGTMLDNTMIVYMSCSSVAHHCSGYDWPFILLGGMGKKLKTGRYIEYPKYGDKGHRTVGSLYLSLMHAAGMKTPDTFGQPDSNLKDLDLKGPWKN
jgi:hypothetical protein